MTLIVPSRDDYAILEGFMVSRCNGCYRSCAVVHRFSSGTPTHCPYGLNQHDFDDVQEEIE